MSESRSMHKQEWRVGGGLGTATFDSASTEKEIRVKTFKT
jgi:hypothetical protein